jgi:WD40 repeat protein
VYETCVYVCVFLRVLVCLCACVSRDVGYFFRLLLNRYRLSESLCLARKYDLLLSLMASFAHIHGADESGDGDSPAIESLSLLTSPTSVGASAESHHHTHNLTRLLQERCGCYGLSARPRGRRGRGREPSISAASSLVRSFATLSARVNPLVASWVEETSVAPYSTVSEYCDLPSNTKSTISISYNATGTAFASSHGDHTIKIIDAETFKVIHTLVGHPRTPWTVKYHPRDTNRVASGCLAGHVKVWDVENETCLVNIIVDSAIISMSFHPFSNIIALVVVDKCVLWRYETDEQAVALTCGSPRNGSRSGQIPVMRCVMFTHDGTRLVVGETNGPVSEFVSSAVADNLTAIRLVLYDYNQAIVDASIHTEWASAFTNPRTITETALLYNCGGIDFSPCSTKLVACIVDNRSTGDEDDSSSKDRKVERKQGGEVAPPEKLELPAAFLKKRSSNRRRTGGIIASLRSPQHEKPEETHTDSAIKIPPFLRRQVRRRPATPYKVVVFSLDRAHFGEFINSAPLTKAMALGVTSVKLSPSSNFAILGCGARPANTRQTQHPAIVSIYRINDTDASMDLASSMTSGEDDLNIALFHPSPGNGFIYGTRHGRIRRVHISNLR